MSFRIGIKTKGDTELVYSSLRFATQDEAEDYQWKLITSWLAGAHSEVQECTDPANYQFKNGELRRIGDIICP